MGVRRLAAALVLAVGLLGLGCDADGPPSGGFEDDATDDGDGPLLPDLPQPTCDPRDLDQCEDGFKCSYVDDPDTGPTNRCVPILGDGGIDEPCGQVDDSDTCGAGLICWGTTDDGDEGICTAFCSTALTCVDEGDVCSVSTDDLLPLCLRRCDPLANTPQCPAEWGCYVDADKRWGCDRDRSGELGAHGDPCECLNCCDPGLVCHPGVLVDAEGCGPGASPGCCAAVCSVDDEAGGSGEWGEITCPTELERCEPLYTGNTTLEGYEHVGLCEL